MDFYIFIRWLQDLTMIVSGFTGIYLFSRNRIKGNLGIIFVYCLITLTIASFSISKHHFKLISDDTLSKIDYLSSIPHYCLLSLFIYTIKKPVVKDIFSSVVFYTWTVLQPTVVLLNYFGKPMLIFAVSNTGLFILRSYYYYKLFLDTNPAGILNNYSFWIVNGIFFCMCVTLPLVAFHSFLHFKNITDFVTFKNINSIGAMAYSFMHFFFIKGFLCSDKSNETYT